MIALEKKIIFKIEAYIIELNYFVNNIFLFYRKTIFSLSFAF